MERRGRGAGPGGVPDGENRNDQILYEWRGEVGISELSRGWGRVAGRGEVGAGGERVRQSRDGELHKSLWLHKSKAGIDAVFGRPGKVDNCVECSKEVGPKTVWLNKRMDI